MASRLTHTVTVDFPVTRYWEIVSTEQYWRDMLEAINSSHGALESFTVDGDTITVELAQGVPEDRLPSMITSVRPGDLHITRRNSYTRTADGITGTFTAAIVGAPAKVDGALAASGDPARVDYTAEVAVSVPFLGGKIEKAIIEQLVDLLDSERDHIAEWAKAHQ
ncbi:MAG: DUF2505 domain-containing protein [Gordonia sp. (in: high G+C Gram-positive bacteria)]